MAADVEDGRQLGSRGDDFWEVEIAGDVVARQAREVDLFDGVAITLDLAVNDRLQRRLVRHRPEALRDKDLPAHDLLAGLPFVPIARRSPGKVTVEVFELLEPAIARPVLGEGGRDDKEKVRPRGGEVNHQNPV